MANEILTISYTHNHECERKDQEYIYFPRCTNGVAEIPEIVCIESGAKLEIIRERKM